MANSYQPQTTKPDLTDVLQMLREEIFLNLNCHAIAKVVSFDSATVTVKAQITYCKQYLERSSTGTYTPTSVAYPLLSKVPVVVLGGGSATLTFPIAAGDRCLILFNDRDISNWVTGAADGSPVASNRKHSLSDGLAIIGFPKITSFDTSHALLKNGTGAVGVGSANKTLITASYPGGPTLLTLLNELINNVKSLVTQVQAITVITTTSSASGVWTSTPPVNSAAIATVTTGLTQTMTDLAGLLE